MSQSIAEKRSLGKNSHLGISITPKCEPIEGEDPILNNKQRYDERFSVDSNVNLINKRPMATKKSPTTDTSTLKINNGRSGNNNDDQIRAFDSVSPKISSLKPSFSNGNLVEQQSPPDLMSKTR